MYNAHMESSESTTSNSCFQKLKNFVSLENIHIAYMKVYQQDDQVLWFTWDYQWIQYNFYMPSFLHAVIEIHFKSENASQPIHVAMYSLIHYPHRQTLAQRSFHGYEQWSIQLHNHPISFHVDLTMNNHEPVTM